MESASQMPALARSRSSSGIRRFVTKGKPTRYLGADVAKIQTRGGQEVWSTSSKSYVENAVKVVEELLEEDGLELRSPKKTKNPFPSNYRPELLGRNETRASRFARMYSAIPDEESSINQTAEKCSAFPIWSETAELY